MNIQARYDIGDTVWYGGIYKKIVPGVVEEIRVVKHNVVGFDHLIQYVVVRSCCGATEVWDECITFPTRESILDLRRFLEEALDEI
ncbi:hypothetical protein KAR91_18315 [Candidatus Pacearchaeota archaeon]|nr:hypothetical protein [Candidatus Pacearchaeota archaeon]